MRVLPGSDPAPVRRVERRHLTVMFADVVGSTRLSVQLDPEALHDVMRSYQTTCASDIGRYEGYVAQYLGDGILAFFGHPVAHEDDAARAVRAGLGVLAHLAELNERVEAAHGVRLSVRIAVHSGLIVLDSERDGPEDASALGHTMNVAARIQETAAPDTLVVSDATRRLIEGQFELDAPVICALRGVDATMAVHRVRRERPSVDRVDRPASRLTPFINREQETALLLERFQRAAGEGGQLVLLRGGPGMGKSRLVREIHESIGESVAWIEARCSPYHEHSVLYPVIQLIEQLFRIGRNDVEGSLVRLEHAVRGAGLDVQECVPILAELLSLPLPARHAQPRLTAEMRRERTFEILCEWLLAAARLQRVVFAMQDLHWADASTRGLLARLAVRLDGSPLLVLLTARPEYEPDWLATEREVRIDLGPLERPEAEEMIERMAKGRPLPREAIAALFAKTDGVPLFLEEMTREALEAGLGDGPIGVAFDPEARATGIPQTLQDSLMAQLDRIGRPRALAQLASAIGREFSLAMLEAIFPDEQGDLGPMLDRLVEAGILVRSEDATTARYAFRHALIRDAAYESMLRAHRRKLHERIANVLVAQFPDVAASQPEVVARHFATAGCAAEAITYLGRAGDLALARCAYQEATHHLERGLALVSELADRQERARRELKLRTTLGTVYFSSQGYGSEAVHATFERARALFDDLGEEVSLEVLNGLWSYNLVRCNADAATNLLPHFRRLMGSGESAVARLAGHSVLGVYAFYTGDLAGAHHHLEAALPYYDTREFRAFVDAYGYDGGLDTFGFCATVSWLLGESKRAAAHMTALEAAAARSASPQAQAAALMWRLDMARSGGEADVALALARQLLALAQAQRMPFYLAVGMVIEGWARAHQRDEEAGLAQIDSGLALLEMTGVVSTHGFYQCVRAEAQLAAGRVDDGLRTIARAAEICEQPLMRFNLANVLRIHGRLLAEKRDAAAVDRLRESLEVSRAAGARALAVEAALAWAEHERATGGAGEGRAHLARLCATFDDGAATPALRRAARILADA